MAGECGEVGVVHGVGFEAWHAGGELGETGLAAAGDDDFFVHVVEAAGEGGADAGGAADDEDGVH